MTESGAGNRCLLIGLHGLGLAVFILTIRAYLTAPLRFDEVEFAQQAQATFQHGSPQIPPDEQRRLYDPPLSSYSVHYGMWHPPLYFYSLAFSGSLLGFESMGMRSAGLAWFAVSLYFLWRIFEQLTGRITLSLRVLPLALIALSPLLAEGALFVDIDNTCLSSTLLLFMWFFLKDQDQRGFNGLCVLGVLFCFCLWAKLTTPMMVLVALVVYQFLRGEFRLGLIQGLAIFVIGSVMFGATYLLYCQVVDYPPAFMFEFTFLGKKGQILGTRSLKNVLQSVRWNMVWMSPPLFLLLLATWVMRIRNYWMTRRVEQVDFLVVFTMTGFVFYILRTATIGKYTYPLALTGALVVAWQLADVLKATTVRWSWALALALAAPVAVHLAIPDLQFKPPTNKTETQGPGLAVLDVRNLYLMLSLSAWSVSFLLTRKWLCNSSTRDALFLSLLFYLIAANPANAAKALLSHDERSPYRPYQERGFYDTVRFLNETASAGQTILAPKDIGYYFHGRCQESVWVVIHGGMTRLQEMLHSRDIRYFVDSTTYPLVPPDEATTILAANPVVATFGTFVVYRVSDEQVEQRQGRR